MDVDEDKSSYFDDLELVCVAKECKMYGFPYFSDGEWKQDATWEEHKHKILCVESLDTLVDYYPAYYNTLCEIQTQLDDALIDHILNDLMVQVDLHPSKEVSQASFLIFLDRKDPLKQIGIIMASKKPEERMSFKFGVDDFAIAEVAHIDFDKVKEWKPKRNEDNYSYIKRLIRGTRGNKGEICKNDNYQILVSKSKHGMAYDFMKARNCYLEMVIKELKEEKQELLYHNALTLDTLIKDLGYNASKFLDDRFNQSVSRRPNVQFSDPLFVEFKSKYDTVTFKKRGRYYSVQDINILTAAKIFGANNVMVGFNADPPYEIYMDKIGLLYNQFNHRFYLKFKNKRRTKAQGQNIHI